MLAAICDDNAVFREELKKFLILYKINRRIHLDIIEFSSGKELLDYDRGIDIIFLDYDMPEMNGISTARKMRENNKQVFIIFITNYPEHVFESFEVNTYRFLLKPIDENKLTQALDDYIKDNKMLSPIVINVNGEQRVINSKDIIYLEADGKFCHIITADECLHTSKTLSKVHEVLPQHCFYRTHKSYVVNFYCIESIKNNCIHLTNGERAAISKKNVTDFKKAYQEFVKFYIARM